MTSLEALTWSLRPRRHDSAQRRLQPRVKYTRAEQDRSRKKRSLRRPYFTYTIVFILSGRQQYTYPKYTQFCRLIIAITASLKEHLCLRLRGDVVVIGASPVAGAGFLDRAVALYGAHPGLCHAWCGTGGQRFYSWSWQLAAQSCAGCLICWDLVAGVSGLELNNSSWSLHREVPTSS